MTKQKPIWLLLFLFIVFFLPLLLAWLQYSQKYSFTSGLTNHGELINPPFPINELQIHHFSQQGKWLILLFYPRPCTSSCQHALYQMRQIRIALDADSDRLQRAILTDQTPDPELTPLLQTDYAGTLHLIVDPRRLANAMKKHTHTTHELQNGTLYLVDPHGNVMMFYPPQADPKGIFNDLQRLLKVSQIG